MPWPTRRWPSPGRGSGSAGGERARTGATLAGLSYAFGAPILFQYCNIIFLVGAAWIPWGLWLVDRWLRLGRPAAILGLAVVLAMQVLGGDPESAYLVGLCLGGLRVLLARDRPGQPEPRPARERGPGLGVALAWLAVVAWVGLTLAAALWLPGFRPLPGEAPWGPVGRWLTTGRLPQFRARLLTTGRSRVSPGSAPLPKVVAAVWGRGRLGLDRRWRRPGSQLVPLVPMLAGLVGGGGAGGGPGGGAALARGRVHRRSAPGRPTRGRTTSTRSASNHTGSSNWPGPASSGGVRQQRRLDGDHPPQDEPPGLGPLALPGRPDLDPRAWARSAPAGHRRGRSPGSPGWSPSRPWVRRRASASSPARSGWPGSRRRSRQAIGPHDGQRRTRSGSTASSATATGARTA